MYYYKHVRPIEGFKRILTDEEMKQFFAAIDNDIDLLFFKLMFVHAKRINELVKLNISDIDFNNKVLYTWVSKQRKNSARKTTYLDPDTQNMIKTYCQRYKYEIEFNNGYLFFCENGLKGHKSKTTFTRRFAALRKKLGFNKYYYVDRGNRIRYYIRSHSLRATAICKVWERTRDLFKTLAFSNHATVEALMPYIKEFERKDLNIVLKQEFGEQLEQGLKQTKLTLYFK